MARFGDRSGSLERSLEGASAQQSDVGELTRSGANACTISTSWGSLVRAQYRPSTKALGTGLSCFLWRRCDAGGANPVLTARSRSSSRDQAPRFRDEPNADV